MGCGNWNDDESYDMDISEDDDVDLDGNPSRKRDGVDGDNTGCVPMLVNLLEHSS